MMDWVDHQKDHRNFSLVWIFHWLVWVLKHWKTLLIYHWKYHLNKDNLKMKGKKRKIQPFPSDLFRIDQSFFALFSGWPLLLTSANISSPSTTGLVDFFWGRLDRKSSSSSNGKAEVLLAGFVVVVVVVAFGVTEDLFSR